MNYADKIKIKVFEFIKENRLLSPGDRVVAGISGGADSVCLLFLLLEWRKICPLTIIVVHVNHGIREEAHEDASFVEELCRNHGLCFELEAADMKKRAFEEKLSWEEAGRLIRYEAFRRAAVKYGAEKVAVAHNMNDKAETMLFHLFRGSGIGGLCSIRPERNGIIRPLLCLERWEIEKYLTAKGAVWKCDSTNEEDEYTRNRIRHHILPYADSQIVKGCVSHMSRAADMLLETEGYLEEQTRKAQREIVVRKYDNGELVGVKIQQGGFVELSPVIGKRLIFHLLKELSPGGRDIGYVHILDVMSLFSRKGNRSVCLPYSITGKRSYEEVWLERSWGETWQKGFDPICVNGEIAAARGFYGRLEGWGIVDMQVFSYEKTEDIPQNEYTKWFDYDKIKKSLIFRTRKTGDYFCIKGREPGERHKSVKDYMVDAKIPKEKRDKILLLAEESHVLWVAGYRISEYYKINENTKRILQVQLRRDCESSGMEEDHGRTCKGTSDRERSGCKDSGYRRSDQQGL